MLSNLIASDGELVSRKQFSLFFLADVCIKGVYRVFSGRKSRLFAIQKLKDCRVVSMMELGITNLRVIHNGLDSDKYRLDSLV